MELANRIEYLRKEHTELLGIAHDLDRILLDVNSGDFTTRQRVLSDLRSLGHRFDGVVEHCHVDDRLVESTYHKYLSEKDRGILADEHLQLVRTLAEFREELRFTTADRIANLAKPGATLVSALRAHLATETAFLNRIAKEAEARHSEKQPAKRLTARAHVAKKKRRARPRKPFKRTARSVPYTMEPHPEF